MDDASNDNDSVTSYWEQQPILLESSSSLDEAGMVGGVAFGT